MAYEDETMRTAAAKAVKSAAPVVSGGVSSRDPEIQAKLAEMSRIKTGDVFRTGLMGAAAGAQAGQGMTNPVAAFVQGAAMGLQVPAQIYEQKQKQIQSVVGATPFGVIVPEAQNPDSPYNILAGLPYDLAVKAIEGIARDTAKLRIEGEQSKQRQREKFEYDVALKQVDATLRGKDLNDVKAQFEVAQKFEALPQVADFNAARPAYESLAGAPGNAAGDKTVLINYARLLSPTFRGNEGTMAAVDVSGIFDKATIGLWAKAVRGEELQPAERQMIKREATRIYNTKEKAYTERMQFWREQVSEYGGNPNIVGKKYGPARAMKTATGEVVYVVDAGNGQFVEVGGQ